MKLKTPLFALICAIIPLIVSVETHATSCNDQFTSIGQEWIIVGGPDQDDKYTWQSVTYGCDDGAGNLVYNGSNNVQTTYKTKADALSDLLNPSGVYRVFQNNCGTRLITVHKSYSSNIDGITMSTATYTVGDSPYEDKFPEPFLENVSHPSYEELAETCNHKVSANPDLGGTCAGNGAPSQVSNPVTVTTGNKYQPETDFGHTGLLSFRRNYNSQAKYKGAIGPRWQHNFERQLLIDGSTALVLRADGKVLKFIESGGVWSSTMEAVATFESVTTPITGYLYTTAGGTKELYESQGRWYSTTTSDGRVITSTYTGNHLTQIADDYGNTLVLDYNSSSGLLDSLTIPGGDQYVYTYDAGMLKTVTAPGGGVLTYHYENPNFPLALTGITDANTNRYATWEYDTQERVFSTFHGSDNENGSHGDEADYYSFVYNTDNTTVTNPWGKDTIYHYTEVAGAKKVTQLEGRASTNCIAANSDYTYYPDGLVHTKTDWEGNLTDYIYNTRGLETSRTEAKGTAKERTITTIWELDFPLRDVVTESGRTTDYEYYTDGKLKSRTLTDTTTHGAGSRGWVYTYLGDQVATINGPRTDVTDVQQFFYTTDGFVNSYTNAMGHLTDVMAHNDLGQPTQIEDPNEVTSWLNYTPRGWLDDITTGGAQTDFGYDDIGQLTSITWPDGTSVNYEYDTAHRLEAIENGKGERIEYTRNDVSNSIATVIKDDLDNVVYQHSQKFDGLRRLQEDLDASNVGGTYAQTVTQSYDTNSNPWVTTDRKQETTTQIYDVLDRLSSINYRDGGTAIFTYDGLDQLNKVTDQNGNITDYDYDGLGNLQQLTSPDTGLTKYDYDAAGNLKKKTDARNVVTEYTYDALNRLKTITYAADPALNITYYYDDTSNGNKGKGRLTGIQDATGSTSLYYDELRRVTTKTVTIQGIAYQWEYAYNGNGKTVFLKMPGGRELYYQYDGLGDLTSVETRQWPGADIAYLVNNVSHYPFGPIDGWHYGNGVSHEVEYDMDSRIEQILDEGNTAILDRSYLHDMNHNVEDIIDAVDAGLNQGFDHDTENRLDTASGVYGSLDYDYDLAGNRTERTHAAGGNNTVETYTYPPDPESSNRLDTLLTKVDGATVSDVTLGYDNVGNITDNGSHTFTYSKANRMASTSGPGGTASYQYNALGQRVVVTWGSLVRHYHYDEGGRLAAESDGSTGQMLKHYLYAEGQLLAVASADHLVDSDSDGFDDDWEQHFFGDLSTTGGGAADSDSDGVLDVGEYLQGTDPNSNLASSGSDHDADGLEDSWEQQYFGGLSTDADTDSDGDGVVNGVEHQLDTDPTTAFQVDSDSDGVPDAWELHYFSTLSRDLDLDWDADGLSDWIEYLYLTDPTDLNDPAYAVPYFNGWMIPVLYSP